MDDDRRRNRRRFNRSRSKQHNEDMSRSAAFWDEEESESFNNEESCDSCQKSSVPLQTRNRTNTVLKVTLDDGTTGTLTVKPRNSHWYLSYVLKPNLDSPSFNKKSRLRFRLPYAQFEELTAKYQQHLLFSRWVKDTFEG